MRLMDEAPFGELIAALRSLKVVGWTSSSEMVGELGHGLLELDLPGDLQDVADRCMNEVRKVWPRIKRRKTR